MKTIMNFWVDKLNAIRSIETFWKGMIIVLSTVILFFVSLGWSSLIILSVMAGLIWMAHHFDQTEVEHAIQQILSGLWKIYLYAWIWIFSDHNEFEQAQRWLDFTEESAKDHGVNNTEVEININNCNED